jgi:hypothetical protein
MSQAVAGELLLDRLIETLMTIAIEHAAFWSFRTATTCWSKPRRRARQRPSASGLSAKTRRRLTCRRRSSRTSAGPRSLDDALAKTSFPTTVVLQEPYSPGRCRACPYTGLGDSKEC